MEYYYVFVTSSDSGEAILSLVLVQTDADLQEHSDPFYVDMDNIGNVSYEPKVRQLCFEYKKGSEDFGELLNIGGTNSKTLYGPKTYTSQRKLRYFLILRRRFAESLNKMALNWISGKGKTGSGGTDKWISFIKI